MGNFSVAIEIAASPQGPFLPLDAMVDTGSIYTWLPASRLRELGVSPQEQQWFVLADGTRIRRDLAEITVRMDGRIRHSLCVFGDEGSLTLLGAVTLEEFGLAVDPVSKRLVRLEVLPALTLLPG